MVWYERYSMHTVIPLICMAIGYDEAQQDVDEVLNEIELVLDAYGDVSGVFVRGVFLPIKP